MPFFIPTERFRACGLLGDLQIPGLLILIRDGEAGVIADRIVLIGLDAVATRRLGQVEAAENDRLEEGACGRSDVEPLFAVPAGRVADTLAGNWEASGLYDSHAPVSR